MTKNYEFTITMIGQGENEDEAWRDATEALSLDPGSTPEDCKLYSIED